MKTTVRPLSHRSHAGILSGRFFLVACHAFLALSVVCLSACSANKGAATESASSLETSSEDGMEAGCEDEEPTLSEQIAANGVYRLSSDGNHAEALEQTEQESWFTNSHTTYLDDLASRRQGEYSPHDNPHWLWVSGESVTVDRASGEKLIVTSQDDKPSVLMFSVQWSGYTVASGVYGDITHYDQVDGIDTSEDATALESRGVYCDAFVEGESRWTVLSEEAVVFDASWYEGTNLKEGRLAIETPAYITPDDYIDPDLVFGSDGYAEVDVSGLESGLYVVHNYSDGEVTTYVVNIV